MIQEKNNVVQLLKKIIKIPTKLVIMNTILFCLPERICTNFDWEKFFDVYQGSHIRSELGKVSVV